ncbi:glyoxylate/hydroxypyruvate reductase HPR3-like [Corylus avellana]|uniref:glyoxylate/hydroxypyruvate reductase HPR3-like n=1 Tax=Corylus avellana TaxID=13451 RepID=UPI00286A307B|nr:glyoxylate/hydroxypyruvate reductase HPR3-like [Corylus avellana]
MSEEADHDHRPLVLMHRLPSFALPFRDRLHSHFRVLDPHASTTADETPQAFLSRHAASVRALITVGPSPVAVDLLDLLPSLQLVVGSSAGVDHIDVAECHRRGIAVTNAGNAFSEDVADYAVALLLDVLRRVSAGNRFVRSGLWPQKGEYPLGSKLGGKRVGIVGLGSIGSEVAKRLVGFSCRVAYNSRNKKPSAPYPYYDNVCDLAVNSDVLVVCCALTDKTHHIINKDVLTALGRDGVLINVGRGALVDEKELVQYLGRGEIGGAGFDVFEKEPEVPKELFAMDNVVLSPHRAVLTPESFEAVFEVIMANLKAFFSNKPLLSPVQHE